MPNFENIVDSVFHFLNLKVEETGVFKPNSDNNIVDRRLSSQNGSAGEDPLDAIPAINELVMEKELDAIVYTQDWHPANHISFVERARDPDRKIHNDNQNVPLKAFDTVQFDKPLLRQTLYPTHCVQNSWGAELHADLVLPRTRALIVKKGQEVHVDSYSAFKDNNRKQLYVMIT
ncbi:hypothetical protein ANCDUO_02467 [Ancylostoma duodenale]|uniref:Isochorismatase-like domain-containing protein n=1 Tax=Ancylostoma duodenale TaxID=51022 RepID=A0A0C2H0A7_9BILA|nr:hypothetical protein ANCDUO_02467 [Ancylostoma duodenale]